MPYPTQDPVPGATPTPATEPYPEASGARPARPLTDGYLSVCDRWVLRRHGRVVGVFGWSIADGWFAAVREDGAWSPLHRPESEEEARRQVRPVAGRGRWVFVEAQDAH